MCIYIICVYIYMFRKETSLKVFLFCVDDVLLTLRLRLWVPDSAPVAGNGYITYPPCAAWFLYFPMSMQWFSYVFHIFLWPTASQCLACYVAIVSHEKWLSSHCLSMSRWKHGSLRHMRSRGCSAANFFDHFRGQSNLLGTYERY